MHTRIVLAAALALGCADPQAAFAGFYSGSYECWGAWDDGSPYSEDPSPQEIEIRLWDASGRAFIAGECPIDLYVTAHGYAEIGPGECLAELSDGSAQDVDWQGGSAYLSEPHFSYSIDITVEPHGGPYPDRATARCYFDGVRAQ